MGGRLRRVTIDLTPLLPGGDNGGAKVLARALVRELSRLAPETHFTLLTAPSSHAELADLDAPNVRRECVDLDLVDLTPMSVSTGALAGARVAARVLVNNLVPLTARTRVKDQIWTLVKRQRRREVARTVLADLHFCPFTAPFFFDPRVPLVSIVHDLQFLDLPEFFDDSRRRDRLLHFQDACERADRVICVSEFVRQTVLAQTQVKPTRVQTIHSAVLHATAHATDARDIASDVLKGLGIGGGVGSPRFLLYPANAWPHKNHRRLLEAFGEYIERWPASDLALVCTGAPSAAVQELVEMGRRELPPGRFAFAGFLPEPEFAALLQTCRALIFPSLYEGFGLPLLEAMACDRPVLCSSAASLPEIAGDAAIVFDPLSPSAIATAIERLEVEPGLEALLVERGRARVAAFGSARDMAANYLSAFEEVVAARARSGAAAG